MGKVVSVSSKLRRDRARRLRREQTVAEAQVWALLRAGRLEGFKWRRQWPIGPFIADFACPEANLVVEIDGGVHLDRRAEGARRDGFLKSGGWRVIRILNSQVEQDLDGVRRQVLEAARRGSDAGHRAVSDRRWERAGPRPPRS